MSAKSNGTTSKVDLAAMPDCFVIMPIAEQDGYESGHFSRVYEDIFKPACIKSGYNPIRADEVKQTNLIHLDILQKLISSPMVVCDLSSRNPNVLFELGLRQAFDMPTVLVKEVGTPPIFDIAPLRYTDYRRELRYREVLEDQSKIQEAITATKESTERGEGVNSIVKILSLSEPAQLKQPNEHDNTAILQMIRAEMSELRSDFRRATYRIDSLSSKNNKEPTRGIMPSRSRLLPAAGYLKEAEFTLERGGSIEEIVKLTSQAQALVSELIKSNPDLEIRSEGRYLFERAAELEKRALESQNR